MKQTLLFLLCLAVPALAQETKTAPPDRAKVLTAARGVMANARYCTMVTVDADGQPRARIVAPFPSEEDMTIWIGTNAQTRKVAQLRANPRVTLLFYDASHEAYVTLTGKAQIVTDPAEKTKRWTGSWTKMVTDKNEFVLVRFTPTRLEIVDPSQGMNGNPTTWEPVGIDMGRK